MNPFAEKLSRLLIERGVKRVEILGIKLLGDHAKPFAEALIVDDLALAQECDGIAHIGIIHQAENVVIGCAGLLLWYDCVKTTY